MARRTTKKTPVKPSSGAAEPRGAAKQMWAVILFALGLLLGALTFVEGDKLWLEIHNVLFRAFGVGLYFFAPLMIYVAVIAAMDKPLPTIRNKVWQLFVLILLICGAIQVFGDGMPNGDGLQEYVRYLSDQGVMHQGGGVVSMLFGIPLIKLFDESGAKIIISLCIFVFTMLVTGSTLIGLFKSAIKPVKGIENAYTAAATEREEKQKLREASPPPVFDKPKRLPFFKKPSESRRFDIDVDISGDSVITEYEDMEQPEATAEMPCHPVVSSGTAVRRTAREKLLGIDSPVEYISPDEFVPRTAPGQQQQDEPPVRRHSLDDDILQAEIEETDGIGDVIEKFVAQGLDKSRIAKDHEIADIEPDESDFDDDALTADDFSGGVDFVSASQVRPVIPEAAAPGPVMTIPAFEARDETDELYLYKKPPLSLLKKPKGPGSSDISDELKSNAEKLVNTLKSFGVQTRITDICRGPAVTRYELQPSAGVKISKITGLSDDIALNLASAGIRIEAPIPNKSAVGIEVPNKVISIVSIREIIDSAEFRDAGSSVAFSLGKDIAGNIMIADIAKMPHMLIAGSTGSGKSVCINSIIISLLYRSSPEDVKLLMIDPKVVELGVYNGIPHLLVPVVTDPKKAAGALNWAVAEMLRRYKEFADNSVRDLIGYNRLANTNSEIRRMPKIVIIIDELADLMMAAPGDVEDSICRLAQMARAAGMHLVIATQRPSVDVITGVIKANIPSRIAFAVSSQVDSRTILDMGGAEKLLGRGDMLFYPVGESKPQRVQGCFVTDAEVEKAVEFIKAAEQPDYDEQIAEQIDSHVVAEKSQGGKKDNGGGLDDEDEMLPQAIECVVDAGMASTSLLQRRLKLGYARAARIIDQMEERGIVGPFEGSKPRQVLITKDRLIEMKLQKDSIR
ncbi:MAG: DNA translocase FtsK [Oscillospiraceae bacterium]|nr:DNA translocase FtsK [Oscillospiraceae bacterium]